MSKSGDERLDTLLKASTNDDTKSYRVVILGYPCDIGVVRNGSPVGARRGPEALRQKLSKVGPLVNPEFNIDLHTIQLADRGDIEICDDLDKNHKILIETVKGLCVQGYICVIVGGGRDQSYCNAKGLMNSKESGEIGVISMDAHLEVRPFIDNFAYNANTYRRLLEDEMFKKSGKLCQFATQGDESSMEHAKFVEDCSGKIVWLSQLQRNSVVKELQGVLEWFNEMDVFMSIDIDSIRGSDCPGGRASTRGVSAQEALDVCLAAGRHQKTRMLDLSEFNPDIEEDRTARLIANMIYYFLMGVASRK